jgi:hypothetical protein
VKRRRPAVVIGAAATAAMVTISFAPPASASAGLAHSAAALAIPGTGITTTTTTSGLAYVLGGVFTGVVDPLINAVVAIPQQVLSQAVSSLTGAGLQADNPSGQQTRPSSGYPDCSTNGWTASDCFGPLLPSIGIPPLIALSTGAAQGYATGDSSGYIAATHIASPQLTLLGINVATLGVIDASASCGTSTCTSTESVTGGSLLNGAIQISVANGTTIATVNGVAVPAAGINVTVAGLGVKAALNGNLLKVTISLSLNQLLAGLGLSGLLGAVAGLGDAGTTASLTLTVGPGSAPASGSTAAWGLEVGVNLAADVKVSLLGLAGVEIAVGSATTPADLLDLKLAYATASSGSTTGTGQQWIPPGLI